MMKLLDKIGDRYDKRCWCVLALAAGLIIAELASGVKVAGVLAGCRDSADLIALGENERAGSMFLTRLTAAYLQYSGTAHAFIRILRASVTLKDGLRIFFTLCYLTARPVPPAQKKAHTAFAVLAGVQAAGLIVILRAGMLALEAGTTAIALQHVWIAAAVLRWGGILLPAGYLAVVVWALLATWLPGARDVL